MKKLFILTFTLLALSQSSFGVAHSPADCIKAAYAEYLTFTVDSATRLCAGSDSDAPVKCVKAAFAENFPVDRAIELCSGAISNAPVKCVKAAFAEYITFTVDSATRLCARATSDAPVKCAIDAFAEDFTMDGAIKLCLNLQNDSKPRTSRRYSRRYCTNYNC